MTNSAILRTFVASLFAVALYGCNSSGNDPGAGGVTKREAEALDAAAAKLDAQTKIPEAQQTPQEQK
jgi:hypothetical protein